MEKVKGKMEKEEADGLHAPSSLFPFTSSIYSASVMHHRLSPKRHAFWYRIYLFYIDIDEIDSLQHKLKWFSYNKFNLFSFRDKDHLQLPKENPELNQTTKQHICTYLREQGVEIGAGKIMLLTNLCVLGYNFNPVSFYFCFDAQQNPRCAVAEISNTYREMKLFFFDREDLHEGIFQQRAEKLFYVSPFIDLDVFFDFKLAVPDEKLDIKIDDYDRKGKKFFISTLMGERKALNNRNMIRYFFAIPLIPLQIMGLIHWQAFKLWIKKIAFHRKAANRELQKNVYKPYQPNQ
ncbi:MAG: DUF1365 domain-containing protein [Pedobacter sp.]|nr:DUF1365 domain-containing protein [Pedobacter sp.]MDQ8053863.1 DUF1365 domain-containing protein [Pedobacter sp.]